MAAVAAATLCIEHLRFGPRIARLLPSREAAGERSDVGVAELGHRLGTKSGTRTRGARQHDALIVVGCGRLNPRLEEATRNVNGLCDCALLVLVRLAHVDQHGWSGGCQLAGQRIRVDFGDLLLDLGE